MSNSLLVDTNLLLLLIVGNVDRKAITKHKRLNKFEETDFEMLIRLMRNFSNHWTTPHILAETSNLIGDGVVGNLRIRFYEELLRVSTGLMKESHIPVKLLINDVKVRYVDKIGIPDVVNLLKLKRVNYFVTDDLPLYLIASNEFGSKAINFEHVRENDWQLNVYSHS